MDIDLTSEELLIIGGAVFCAVVGIAFFCLYKEGKKYGVTIGNSDLAKKRKEKVHMSESESESSVPQSYGKIRKSVGNV